MRVKTLITITIFILLINIVNAQATGTITEPTIQTNNIQAFEQSVVKEHFITRKELKTYLDEKAIQQELMVNGVVANSFDEFNNLLNKKINKFLIKISILVFGLVFFINSLYYFVKKKFDRKHNELIELMNKNPKKDIKPPEKPKIPPPPIPTRKEESEINSEYEVKYE
jgi:hypothetical protein